MDTIYDQCHCSNDLIEFKFIIWDALLIYKIIAPDPHYL